MARLALLTAAAGLLLVSAASSAQTASGGVAIGGNVTGSTITVGITPKKAEELVRAAAAKWRNLTDAQRAELRGLERELGVTDGALRTFFAVLGEKEVPSDALPARLGEIAAAHLALKAQLQSGSGESPEKTKLKAAARAALDAGRLAEADDILSKIEALQDESLEAQLRERVQTAEQRATLAVSRLRYRDAAAQYAAAERFAPDDKSRDRYARMQVRSLLEQAEEFDDAAAQSEAVRLLRAKLAALEGPDGSEAWGRARRDLGLALVYRGVARATATELDEALRLLREARAAPVASKDLEYRIDINETYGMIHCDIGELRHDAALAKDGAGAFSEAIKELNAAGAHKSASFVSIGLANCSAADALPTYDTKTLAVLRQTFAERRSRISKAAEPFAWAEATVSMAGMSMMIGRNERSMTALNEAAELLRSALTVLSVETSPNEWEGAEATLTLTLLESSKLRGSVAPLEEAKEILDAALPAVRSKPIAARRRIEMMRFQANVELGKALDDPAVVEASLAEAKQAGLAPEALDESGRIHYEEVTGSAKAYLDTHRGTAGASVAAARPATLALSQLELDVATLPAAEAQAKTAAFAAELKTVRRCRDGAAVAQRSGATIVENDAVAADKLPEPLRSLIAAQKVGSATQPFGTGGKVRSLVLCGRRSGEAIAAATP